MENNNELKADRMSQVGEWDGIERRDTECSVYLTFEERRAAQAELNSASRTTLDNVATSAPVPRVRGHEIQKAAQELIRQAELSLDYRPEFRRAISNLNSAVSESSATPSAGTIDTPEFRSLVRATEGYTKANHNYSEAYLALIAYIMDWHSAGVAAKLEDAAQICDAKFAAREASGHPREASTSRALAEEIRALASNPAATRPAQTECGALLSREEQMVVIRRDNAGVPTVWCDPEIVTLVAALNDADIPTIASCSGHGGPFGNIALRDGRELLILPNYEAARAAEKAIHVGVHEALAELVAVQDLEHELVAKDYASHTYWYREIEADHDRRLPLAWEGARTALASQPATTAQTDEVTKELSVDRDAPLRGAPAATDGVGSAVPAELPEGFMVVPHYRGYANLGTGNYLVNHSAAGEPAELVISVATDEQKAGRAVGDEQDNVPGEYIQPDIMCVRVRFESAAGLDVLENQLRYLRNVHFAAAAAPVAQAPVVQDGEYVTLKSARAAIDHLDQSNSSGRNLDAINMLVLAPVAAPTQVAPVLTDAQAVKDAEELVDIAGHLREVKHWAAQAAVRQLAEMAKRLMAKAERQPQPADTKGGA